MSDFYNSHTDVGFLLLECGILQLRCRLFTTWMSDFYYSNMGFLQLGRRIFTTRMSDFYYSDMVFLLLGCRIFTTRMWHFCNLHGCRIFTTRMSDFTTWMPDFYNSNGTYKIRRLHYYASRALSCMLIYVIFGLSKLIDPLQKWLAI